MKRLYALLLVLPLLLAGCLYDAADEPQASQIVAQLHKSYQQQDWDTLFSLYDDKFLAEHPREAWQAELQGLLDRYGPLKSFHQTFEQKDPRFRGDYYIFGYRLVFEKGSAKETITVFKGIESDKLAIAGHMIQPRNP